MERARREMERFEYETSLVAEGTLTMLRFYLLVSSYRDARRGLSVINLAPSSRQSIESSLQHHRRTSVRT
jgi:hypothetical protein